MIIGLALGKVSNPYLVCFNDIKTDRAYDTLVLSSLPQITAHQVNASASWDLMELEKLQLYIVLQGFFHLQKASLAL